MNNEQWTSIVESPDFIFPGTPGVSSDAVASPDAGWGAHAFDNLAGAVWTYSTTCLIRLKLISINPLELIATMATVVLLGK